MGLPLGFILIVALIILLWSLGPMKPTPEHPLFTPVRRFNLAAVVFIIAILIFAQEANAGTPNDICFGMEMTSQATT